MHLIGNAGEGSAADALVSFRDVHVKIGSVQILNGVSLRVARGEVVCIIGPSGSGKSTILRCVNAQVAFQKGAIQACGFDVGSPKLDKLALRRRVGIVFQQYNLFPHRTALDNIMMAPIHVLKQDRASAAERARALLARVRLADIESRYPAELSGGQQQRVAIARCLAMQPDLIMFDEVTAALDPQTSREVLTTIRELVDDGMTCIVVTHEMAFAREISDRVYFTDRGVIIESGTAAEIFSNPKQPETKHFLAAGH
jgi:polar amino acid transport system ATP-binding protein